MNLVADWLELRVLTSEDGECTLADLPMTRRQRRDKGEGSIATIGEAITAISDVEADTGSIIDAVLGIEGQEDWGPFLGDQPARIASLDRNEDDGDVVEDVAADNLVLTTADMAEVGDVMEHLRSRLMALGPLRYPFEITGDSLVRRPSSTAEHHSYIGLLLSSNLNRLDKAFHNGLAVAFERLGAAVLAGWLGGWYRVEQFGTGAFKEDRYGGAVREALPRLAQDLGWPVREGIIEKLVGGGDRGLDVVAFHIGGEGDTGQHWPVIFAQCGVGKDWESKQEEVGIHRWRKLLDITGPLLSVLLIPYWHRTTDGQLERADWLGTETTMLDRLRILRLLRTRVDHTAAAPVAWASFVEAA